MFEPGVEESVFLVREENFLGQTGVKVEVIPDEN